MQTGKGPQGEPDCSRKGGAFRQESMKNKWPEGMSRLSGEASGKRVGKLPGENDPCRSSDIWWLHQVGLQAKRDVEENPTGKSEE